MYHALVVRPHMGANMRVTMMCRRVMALLIALGALLSVTVLNAGSLTAAETHKKHHVQSHKKATAQKKVPKKSAARKKSTGKALAKTKTPPLVIVTKAPNDA